MNPLQIAGSILGAVLALGAAGIAWHCWTVTQEYVTFKDGVEAEGKKAKAAADKRETDDKKSKEKADAQTKLDRARIAALTKQLRDARSRSSFLPPASPLTTSPQRACFGRTELERTLQRLDDDISSIVAEGDFARVGLDNARQWAKEVTP